MAAVLKIDDTELRPARLDNKIMRALLETEFADAFERMELIDGVLIEMTPAKRRHAAAHSRITFALHGAVSADLEVLIDPRVYLGRNSMVGPDIAVARRGTDSDDVPVQHLLLAIEISDTSLRKDIVQKARLYGAGGVAEYWVVDLENRKLHVHGGPGSKGYGAVAVRDWDEPVNPLFAPELALDLGAILRDLQ